jgi:hypothetical protein
MNHCYPFPISIIRDAYLYSLLSLPVQWLNCYATLAGMLYCLDNVKETILSLCSLPSWRCEVSCIWFRECECEWPLNWCMHLTFFVQGVLALFSPSFLLKRLMCSYGIAMDHKKYIIIHNLHFQVSLYVHDADCEVISSNEMENIFTRNL